jgi:hypothetical protein
MVIPIDCFESVEGSMTSNDGQLFLLHVKRADGADIILGFPHRTLLTIVENAAMQAQHGKDDMGVRMRQAFKTTGFRLGRGPTGEALLSLQIGEGASVSFLLPGAMPSDLVNSLGTFLPKN